MLSKVTLHFVWLFLIMALITSPLKCSEVYRLETMGVSMAWENGKLTSFQDRVTKREWARAPVIPVQIYLFGDRAPLLTPGPQLVWVRTEVRDTQTLVHHYQATVRSTKLSLQLQVSVEGAETVWFIAWQSSGSSVVAQVRAPYLAVPRGLGGSSEDDYLVAPNWEGQGYRDPANGDGPLFPNRADSPDLFDTVLWPGEMRFHMGDYPGRFSAQFETYYDSGGGLLLWTPDPEGWTKEFRFDRTLEGPFMGVCHYAARPGVQSYKQPYMAKTTFFTGDWYDAADIYRQWALTQAWTARKVGQRDYAPMVRQPFLFLNPAIREWQPRTAEAFAAIVRSHSKLFSAPIAVNFFGWEKDSDWAAGDYYPPTGGEAFREGAALVRKEGNRVFEFNSGHRYAVKLLRPNVPPEIQANLRPNVPPEAQARRAAKWNSIKDEMGAWWWDGTLNCLDMTYGVRDCMLNIGSPAVRKVMTDDFLEATRWGISMVQADQDMSLNLATSWKQPSGVPTGYGKLVSNLGRQWFGDVRREGRKLDSDYTTSIERPNEFTLQEIDIYHHQPYRYGGGAFAQPVYAYLYHDFQVGYSGWTDVVANFSGADGWIHALATAATWGQIIGVRTRFVEEDQKAGRLVSPYAQQVKEIVAFQRGGGNPFLICGRMLPKPKLEGVSVLPELPRTSGGGIPTNHLCCTNGLPRLGETESVLTGSFQASDGRIGTLLCNVTQKDLKIKLDPARWNKTGKYSLTRRVLGQSAAVPVATGSMRPVSISLPALKFVWLEWRPL